MTPDGLIAIIGSGQMGAGIAQIAAAAGQRVLLHDSRPGVALGAVSRISEAYHKLVARGKMPEELADAARARISVAESITDCAAAELVVEAIVEDAEAKQALFADLEEIVPEDCILASNTSSISITLLAAKLKHPARFVGMHFFNPVPLMDLVEVVRGLGTSDHCAAQVHQAAARWGKTPVFARSTPGFIVNRVARPYYAEALRLLQEGAASPASLDAIMRDAGGFRMGPFELMDLIGHDTNFAVTRSIFNAYFCDQRFTPSLIQQELVDAGRLGRKTGRGFFEYGEGVPAPQPDYEASEPTPLHFSFHGDDALIRAIATRLHSLTQVGGKPQIRAGQAVIALTDGRTATDRATEAGINELVLVDYARDFAAARTLAVSRAQQCNDAAFASAVGLLQAAGYRVIRLRDLPGLALFRTVAMLANEAADAVNQGVCTVEGVNAAMCRGVNYPLGPLAWADQLGVARVADLLSHLRDYYGEDRYRTSPLLRSVARRGGSFGQ